MKVFSCDMQIRVLALEDYEVIVSLWKAAGLPYRPQGRDRKDRMARNMADPRSCYLGAEEDSTLLGVVLATHDGRKGWINRLAVAPSAQRQGGATALVRAAEEKLTAQGIRILACLIERENGPSLSLFASLGYGHEDGIVYLTKRLDPDI